MATDVYTGMMRRTFSLVLALILAMALCGCISSDETAESALPTQQPTTIIPATAQPSETSLPPTVPPSTTSAPRPPETPVVHEPLVRPTTTLPPETCPPQREVYALSHMAYDDRAGHTVVVGEVINSSSDTVASVRVCVVFYDACGRVAISSFAYTMIDVLVPGQRAPFEVSSYPVATGSGDYSLSVSYLPTSARPYTGLRVIRALEHVDMCGYHTITGEVGNIGCCTMLYVKVVATYYDASGIVIGAAYVYTTPRDIARCDSSLFELSSFPQHIAPYRYSLQVQGQYRIPGPS